METQARAKFKVRFNIVSKGLKTGFLIFSMRNKAKQKSTKCSASD